MTGNQFLAIAPEGNFMLSSLEFVPAADNTVVVRIIDSNRLLAVRVDLDLLKQQIAQLRSRPNGTRTQRARVLFSPLPEAETRLETALEPSGVDDAAGSPTGAASVPPRAAAPEPGAIDRPLPAVGPGPEAASSPSATPRTEPARPTPNSIRRQQRYDHPTGQRWSPA